MTSFDKPIVAAVRGLAIGIGVTMLLHCDIVCASPCATFTAPFVDLGLVPEAGATMILPQHLGYQRAAQLLLLGERISADQALGFGLVNVVVDSARLMETATGFARRFAEKPQTALLQTRALMKASQERLNLHMQTELEAFAVALNSDEVRERLSRLLTTQHPDILSPHLGGAP